MVMVKLTLPARKVDKAARCERAKAPLRNRTAQTDVVRPTFYTPIQKHSLSCLSG